jgi:hypothetical protein
VTKTLRLIKSKELEIGTLVMFDFGFEFSRFFALNVEGLDACIVLPNETLKLSRSVSQFTGSLR